MSGRIVGEILHGRPRALDVFAGAGGCSKGYHDAGWEVTGVDSQPHPDYPYELIEADALDVLRDTAFLGTFDLVHTSPPCPGYSTITPDPGKHPRLIAPVRRLLRAWGGLYVIENVMGARSDMQNPVMLCGSSFGLRVRRHRLFETNGFVMGLPCDHKRQGTPVGVYGDHPDQITHARPNGTSRGRRARTLAEGQAAMGIDWMGWDDLADAIPPAYTEYVGQQLLDALVTT